MATVMSGINKLFSNSTINNTRMLGLGPTAFRCKNWSNYYNQLPVIKVSVRNMSCDKPRTLSIENMNPFVKTMEYAVRGPLLIRAAEIELELQKGPKKTFDSVIRCNIGDAHAMGQHPITYIRQVVALCTYPHLLEDCHFPEDAKALACTLRASFRGGSAGSYTESPGIDIIRKYAAEYIEKRDCGVPACWENIMLSAGASEGIKNLMKLLVADVDCKPPGFMTPIPQYPLYSAALAEFNFKQVGYYLDEENNWGLDINELQKSLEKARCQDINVRAIVVINPGNPTGQVLTRENIEEVIKFAYCENLYIFADEVYQDNIYEDEFPFHSFKKILMEMGDPYSSKVELASFMSCSKCYMGECGFRGGYTEIINMCPDVKTMYLKSVSAMLCPNVFGQVCMACVVHPPQPGDPSYCLFTEEKEGILDSLNKRAKMLVDILNGIDGVTCNKVQGAMYAFPKITLPPKVIELANQKKQAPDVFFAFELLENTGICVIAGSGFLQKPNTYHFRTTILPQPELLKKMLDMFAKFYKVFMDKYK